MSERRLDRYAEAIVANLGLTKDETEPMHIEVAYAVMAEADADIAKALRSAAGDRSLRLSGHSGVSVNRLRQRADEIEPPA